jgi:hypothetical protein
MLLCFSFVQMPRTILGYMGYHAVAIHENPYNLEESEGSAQKENRTTLQQSSRSLFITTYTPDDDQLRRNM